MKRVRSILLGALLALAILVAALWLWSLHRDESLRAVWRQEIFDGLEPGERFPPRQRNETALALEGLAAEMGLDFSVGDRPAASPGDEGERRWARTKQLLKRSHWALRASTDDRAPALGPELAGLVDEHAEPMDRVLELLLGGDPPRWEFDIELGAEAPLSNLTAQLQLHRLLQLAAHRALDMGDEAAAADFLNGAWRLGREPAENPILIAQLIRLVQLSEELLVLRRFCSLDPVWRRRLESLDLRSRALRGLQLEGWVLQGTKLPLGDDLVLSPTYQRFMFLPLGEAVQHSVERLRTENPRTLDINAFFQEELERIPRWAGFSRIFFPQLLHGWPKTVRAELVIEHTVRILEARRRLAQEQAVVSARLPSTAVAGLFWLEESTPTGVRIALDGEFTDGGDHPVALDYTIDGASCARAVGPAEDRSTLVSATETSP